MGWCQNKKTFAVTDRTGVVRQQRETEIAKGFMSRWPCTMPHGAHHTVYTHIPPLAAARVLPPSLLPAGSVHLPAITLVLLLDRSFTMVEPTGPEAPNTMAVINKYCGIDAEVCVESNNHR